jgi:methionyl-tRNA formyltransferase
VRVLKLLIVTQSEPFYIPRFFAKFIPDAAGEGISIERIVCLKPFNETLDKTALRMFNLYGPRDFFVMGLRFVLYKIKDMLGLGLHSVRKVAATHGIPCTFTANVNYSETLEEIRKSKPDVILSIAASQIFKKELLSIPKWGCINVHTANLPKYRGMLPTFWAMYHGDHEVGMTVFRMDSDIDRGMIILQEEIPIEKTDTLEAVIIKTKLHEADMVIRSLKLIRSGEVRLKDYEGAGSYYTFPTRKDAEQFRLTGRKFF